MRAPTITSPGEGQAFEDERLAEGSDYIKNVREDFSKYDGSRSSISWEVLPTVNRQAHASGKLEVLDVSTRESARAPIGDGLRMSV